MGNMEQVGLTLEAFAAKCHDFVKAEPGPAGRQKICTLLSQVLKDEQFVAEAAKLDLEVTPVTGAATAGTTTRTVVPNPSREVISASPPVRSAMCLTRRRCR